MVWLKPWLRSSVLLGKRLKPKPANATIVGVMVKSLLTPVSSTLRYSRYEPWLMPELYVPGKTPSTLPPGSFEP